jgi:hypothetical protein
MAAILKAFDDMGIENSKVIKKKELVPARAVF